MKAILVLTDFSRAARSAAEAGMHIALKIKVQLLLLNSYHLPQIILTEVPGKDYLELGADSKKNLNSERERLIKIMELQGKVNQTSIKVISSIDPIAEILYDIQQGYKILLTIMGRHKSYGNSFLFANHIHIALSHSSSPLLIVTTSEFKTTRLRVNFASDLDPKDLPLTQYLSQLAKAFNSSLSVTHVLGKAGLVADFNEEDRLKVFSLELKGESFDGVGLRVLEGKSIVSEEQKQDVKHRYDLLVVINRRHELLHELFHASHCRSFIKKQKIPILVMPEDWNGNGCPAVHKKRVFSRVHPG